MLHYLNHLPIQFFDAKPESICSVFPKPTLITLKGKLSPPLFISILLHGNETSGLLTLQRFLKRLDINALPRALYLFVGNVYATEKGVRKLPHAADFNRIWRGGSHAECSIAREVFDTVKKTGLWAAVDLHNNTGRNPCYGCVANTGEKELHLASLFSDTVIHSQSPIETLCHAFSELCPSITCECSQPGCPNGISKAEAFLEKLMQLTELGATPDPSLRVLESPGRIYIPKTATMAFTDEKSHADFVFPKDYDLWNFKKLEKDHIFGIINHPTTKPVILTETGQDITSQFFSFIRNQIIVKNAFLPAMLTTSPQAVYDDCLGYILISKPADRKFEQTTKP